MNTERFLTLRPSQGRRRLGRQALGLCLALTLLGCSKNASTQVEPLSVDDTLAVGADASNSSDDADTSSVDALSNDTDTGQATIKNGTGVGGLWVVDAKGQPVGAVVQRGHPNLGSNGATTSDLLRDGVLVYSPKTALFFGMQMSTGKVLSPRLGVADATCQTPIVAGYYTDGDFVSGQGYAFVYAGSWYKIKDFATVSFVTCGGTVQDGADGVCSPHAGSCRGFPVQSISPQLATSFAAPLAFAWLTP